MGISSLADHYSFTRHRYSQGIKCVPLNLRVSSVKPIYSLKNYRAKVQANYCENDRRLWNAVEQQRAEPCNNVEIAFLDSGGHDVSAHAQK